ncbi:hypothetical protein PINS_up006551 [Pythium insidiosum]|nr:hypothetical protein PINS_up006551 [Pythium insidiosum]
MRSAATATASPGQSAREPTTPRRSSRLSIDDWSLFSSWRSSRSTTGSSNSSSRKQSTAGAADLASLDGKALRDAVWRESQQQTARRGPRVIRFDPNGDAHGSESSSDGSDAAPAALTPRMLDDAASSSTAEESSHAVTTPRAATRAIPSSSPTYDMAQDADDGHPTKASGHEAPPSRLSLSFGRLSLRARDSVIADYKAKKYDVDWKRDQDCPDCQLCRLVFTKLSRRRHHCRICGDVVCSDCSQDQVHCVDRFARPKRACAACFALLEAMMHLGDRRVKMYAQQRGADGTSAKEWTKVMPASACLATSASTSSSTRYHDRGTEIQRVAAAGKKARRPGSLGRRCVISASWLRAWLAFTRSDDDGSSSSGNGDADAGASDHMLLRSGRYRALSSVSALSSAFDGRGAPPGPIDNLSLLELRQGVLRERHGLVQCRTTQSQTTPRHADARGGEYQIISLEVWDVLYRFYGGGPLIEVVAGERPGAPDDWIVDVAAVLRRSRALGQAVEAAGGSGSGSLTPSSCKSTRVPIATTLTVADQIIERTLMERHDPFHILLDVSDGAFSNSYSGSSAADSPSPLAAVEPHSQAFGGGSSSSIIINNNHSNSNSNRSNSCEPTPESDGRSKRIVKTSSFHHRHATEPDREPMESQPQRATSLPPPRPSTRESTRDQSAAQAASAFALAMKQARLNAQKAISRPREQQL